MQKTEIIKLKDGIEVEVELNNNYAQEISNKKLNINTSMEDIQYLLSKLIKPFKNTYNELNKEMNIENAKISLGIKIGVEGNFILAKSSAGANITVELTLKGK